MVRIKQLFLLNIFFLVPFFPVEAITEKTANFLTTISSAVGGFLGGAISYDHACKTVLTKHQPTMPLYKRTGLVMSGLAGGALLGAVLGYILTVEFRPGNRYIQADEIIKNIQKEPLILALQYHDYAQAVQRLYVRHKYPLLEAWKKLCNHLDAVLVAKQLLEVAAKDVAPSTSAYNQIFDLLEAALALESQINDKLFLIKQDPDYREQSRICYEYDLSQAYLAAQQAAAQAALSKAVAEHERNKIRIKELCKIE